MPLNQQNDDPGFERRLILAFALSILLFLVVMPFISKKAPAPGPASIKRPGLVTQPAPPAPAPARPSQPVEKAAPPPAIAAAKPTAPAQAIAAASEQQLAVDTPVYHVVFSNRGANVRTWILTQYKDDAGNPLNFVDPAFSSKFGYPLAFWVQDSGLRQQLDQALYQVNRTTTPDGSQVVSFTWSNGSLHATKQITFERDYLVRIQSSVTRDGQPLPAALAWQGAFGDRAVPGDFDTEQLLQQSGSSVQTFAVKKVTNGAAHEGQFHFAGLQDKYFAAVFLPQGDQPLSVTELKSTYQPKLTDAVGNYITNKPVDTIGLAVSNGDRNDTLLFVGPKKIDLLQSIDPALRGLVNFGWFSFVADPLFLWMNWTYAHWIHNYGWVIVFITFIITMAVFPLRMKAQKSQAKMMAVQPKINALNAKMKKYPMRDPRRAEVQQEVMKVYSEHGVNPLGGCLPMLIQLPLIYAFYEVLEYAIELRHAPWIGYFHDLSAKDPYFILPLGIVVAQFFTTALMPTMPGQDPRQAKMMKWVMPIFMGWFFFYLPSGVNLYYLFSTVLGAGQQWVANRTYNNAALAAVAASDARKGAKSAGKAKVIEGKALPSKR